MDKETQPNFIEDTAGEIAGELTRRGISPIRRVTATFERDELDDSIAKARKLARPKVIAERWTDADIDRIVKEERKAAALESLQSPISPTPTGKARKN